MKILRCRVFEEWLLEYCDVGFRTRTEKKGIEANDDYEFISKYVYAWDDLSGGVCVCVCVRRVSSLTYFTK